SAGSAPSISADSCSRLLSWVRLVASMAISPLIPAVFMLVLVCAGSCVCSIADVVVFQEWLHAFIDGLAGPEDARADGADRAVHAYGDLFVTHAFHLAEGNRFTQFLRQFFDRAQHGLFQLLAHQFALGRVVVAQAQAGLELLGILDPDVVGRWPPVAGN